MTFAGGEGYAHTEKKTITTVIIPINFVMYNGQFRNN